MGCFSSYCAKIFLNFLPLAQPAFGFLPGLAAQVLLLSRAPLYPSLCTQEEEEGRLDGEPELPLCQDELRSSRRDPLPRQSRAAGQTDVLPLSASFTALLKHVNTHTHASTACFLALVYSALGALSLLEGGCKHTTGLNPLLAALQICEARGKNRSWQELPLFLQTQLGRHKLLQAAEQSYRKSISNTVNSFLPFLAHCLQ